MKPYTVILAIALVIITSCKAQNESKIKNIETIFIVSVIGILVKISFLTISPLAKEIPKSS